MKRIRLLILFRDIEQNLHILIYLYLLEALIYKIGILIVRLYTSNVVEILYSYFYVSGNISGVLQASKKISNHYKCVISNTENLKIHIARKRPQTYKIF